MKVKVHIPCPHCGRDDAREVEITSVLMPLEVWHCYEDDGGCGRNYVVQLMAEPQARTTKLEEMEQILGSVLYKRTPKL